MTDILLRNDIGARNPYVAAELEQGQRIDWKKKSPEEKTRKLETSFKCPFNRLFDPVYGSPLFPKKRTSGVFLPSTGSGDPTSCTSNPCPPFDDFLPLPGGLFTVNNARFEDPIQGCLPNCYFVAALCAFAWAIRSAADFQNNIALRPYNYTFNIPETNPDGSLVIGGAIRQDAAFNVTNEIPIIKPDTLLYSRANDYKEIWPCIYEKAYATWVYCRKHGCVPGPGTKPNYMDICQGNPVTTLIHLTGKPFTTYNTNTLADGDSYNKIRTQFAPNGSLKTYYPTVAWTYATAPAGVSYSNDVIVANHSYTVLGVYPQPAPADLTKTYIVMRNPFGQSNGDPKLNVDPNIPADAFYQGAWGPLGRALGDSTDGIFAFKDPVFRKYFAGFGWVKY